VDWKLPGGRPAAQHHIFPLQPPPAGTLQEPVYVSRRRAAPRSPSASSWPTASVTAVALLLLPFRAMLLPEPPSPFTLPAGCETRAVARTL
jgi:hypothetical protein